MCGLAAVDTSQSKGLIPLVFAPGSPDAAKIFDDTPPKCPKEEPQPKPIRENPPFKNPRFPPVVPNIGKQKGKNNLC